MMAPSKRNCRIAQRIARTTKRARGAHTLSLCSRNVTVWQVRSQHIQRRIVPPDPCRDPGPRARRSPPPPHARDLEQVTPQPGHPAQRSHRSLCRAPDHTHAEQQQPDGNPPSRQADHTDHNDQATQSSSRWVRHRPGSLTIGSRSPLIIRDLDLYPQPPTNTRSPALNSEEPEKPAHRRGPQPLPASPDHGSVTHTQRGRVTMTDEEPFVEAYRQGC